MYKHVFSICAYGESQYLEDCVISIIRQKNACPHIIMCTSTPNRHIRDIAQKYNIKLYVNTKSDGIWSDWMFAYRNANSQYVTIAHQDDKYDRLYLKNVMENADENMSMLFTDYLPIKNGIYGKRDANSRIRRLLRLPMKIKLFSKIKWMRKAIFRFGNSVCCPSCTYNKEVLKDNVFDKEWSYNIDWMSYAKMAELPHRFVYVDKQLTYYRIHDDATSSE